jgi:hypothetical protein
MDESLALYCSKALDGSSLLRSALVVSSDGFACC